MGKNKSKKRDKKVHLDDFITVKKSNNYMKDENQKLKTHILRLEADNAKKDKMIDDILGHEGKNKTMQKLQVETHLAAALKR